MPDYTKLTNLEVTGHLKVAGQEVTPGGGSGGGVLVVNDVDGVLDKTWQEIHDADIAILKVADQIGYVYKISSDPVHTSYSVAFFSIADGTSFDDPLIYASSTPNGYPQWYEGD